MEEALNRRYQDKSSIQDATGDRQGERLLELSLPALVLGKKISGRSFSEKTELIAINSKLVTFFLKTPVKIGSSLKLAINIPATALLIYPLKLELKGQVARLELEEKKNRVQLVTVELDHKFELRPQSYSAGPDQTNC
ncbi:MAG: hypothetical protein WC524_02710 [Candidatus Aminicenantales bacterium]|jgi:hypothetical protein|nr:hypothetical protein [Acidobacteriota bacterium]